MSTPLALRAVPLHPTLVSGQATKTHLLVQSIAVAERPGPRPRLTTMLLLDVSGSMQGEPLAQVIRSAQLLADILPDGDMLGVVAFDSNAHTIAEPRPLDGGVRAATKAALAMLRANSGTNLSAGLSRAALLLPPRKPDERQLLLVLTDGQANEGVFSVEGLTREVSLIRARDVVVSTLGYGGAHNEDLLDALAVAGGGRYSYVKDPLLARMSFVRALGSQLDVVAEGVRLIVAPDPGVEVVRVLGGPAPTFGAQGLAMKLQDPIAGERASLVLELNVQAPPHAGPFHLAELTIMGKVAGTDEPFTAVALASVTLGAAAAPPDPEASALVAVALADELREQARALGARRDFAGAIALLERAVAQLEATPGFVAGGTGPLNDAREALRDDITVLAKTPTAEEYGTYRKAQKHEFDFAAGSKAFTNQVGVTPGTVHLTNRANRSMPGARLIVVGADDPRLVGARFTLGPEATIGRASELDVALADNSVSRRHAKVVFDEGAFWVFDLGSSNETAVNGVPVMRHRLAQGDVVRVGRVNLRFDVREV